MPPRFARSPLPIIVVRFAELKDIILQSAPIIINMGGEIGKIQCIIGNINI
jgi:hypothetical protein